MIIQSSWRPRIQRKTTLDGSKAPSGPTQLLTKGDTVHFISPAEIFGVDGIIILIVVVLVLFGSTQIPKLAHSLGSAQKEFKKGIEEGHADQGPDGAPVVQPAVLPVVVAPAPSAPAEAAEATRATGTPS